MINIFRKEELDYHSEEINISIDMLAVGDADAIIIWLKNSENSSFVIVLDAGNPGDGQKVIDHLDNYILPYAKKDAPDLLICSHYDQDHIGGLLKVVERYKNGIGMAWVHNYDSIPSVNFSLQQGEYMEFLRSERNNSVCQLVLESLNQLNKLVSKLDFYNIRYKYPFTGLEHEVFPIQVIGPSKKYYKSLIESFTDVNNYNNFLRSGERRYIRSLMEESNNFSRKAFEVNDSSVILLIKAQGKKYLFTGNAGIDAISDALTNNGIADVFWLKVPHHGSIHNMDKHLIEILSPKIAYISAEGNNEHPSRKIISLLKGKGTKVKCTYVSDDLWYCSDPSVYPKRAGYRYGE